MKTVGANTSLRVCLQILTRYLLPKPPPFSLLTTRQHRSETQSSVEAEAEEEVKKMKELLPRLCETNHLHEAIRLTHTLILTNPPLQSVSHSLHILVDRLSSEPTMTQSMSLLNRLKHSTHGSPFLPHINQLLIASYLDKKRFKEAIKVFRWASSRMRCTDKSPCNGDAVCGRMLVKGLCENNMTMDALVIVKKMLEDHINNVVAGDEVRVWVYRSLLREARIKEAKELNQALVARDDDDVEETNKRVIGLLDSLIGNWTD